jgi:hypothetical protein
MSAPLRPDAAYSAVDHSFVDARARVLDVAAFLDRVQRYGQQDDFRIDALRKAIAELSSDTPGRVERILNLLSDPTDDPIPQATTKAAAGAYLGTTSA